MAHILDGDGLRTRAGWSCPGCSRCYGPQVDECPHCPALQTADEFIARNGGSPGPWPPGTSGLLAADEPAITVPAIFVPLRDVPGMTPSRMADLQRMLNDMPAVMFGDVVDGKFIVLPVGAKILPAHPGR